MNVKKLKDLFILVICTILWLAALNNAQITVHVNSGNPAIPIPQFFNYNAGGEKTLYSLADSDHQPNGVSHAEMEQWLKDALQIMMNRADYAGGTICGVKGILFEGAPTCSEGHGYALLAAALMADKETFDGLWFYLNDNCWFAGVQRYSNGEVCCPDYKYGYHSVGVYGPCENSACDGDFDIAMAALIAWRQWGDNTGYTRWDGQPIRYKDMALDMMRFMVERSKGPDDHATNNWVSGDVGFDGYHKSGDSWGEMTDWAQCPGPSPYCPDQPYPGTGSMYYDYTGPAYFQCFSEALVENGDPRDTEDIDGWNVNQHLRAAASTAWLQGKLASQHTVPVAGSFTINGTSATFANVQFAEDLRSQWRHGLYYLWYGNPDYTWDPSSHQPVSGGNSFEYNAAVKLADFYYNHPYCHQWGTFPLSAGGAAGMVEGYNLDGSEMGQIHINNIFGAGAGIVTTGQNFQQMEDWFRELMILWDSEVTGDGYITSAPRYFHGFFRVLGLLILTGNHVNPCGWNPQANMKVYISVDKTYSFSGEPLTYKINYRNYGSVTASGVVITDALPDQLEYISSSPSGSYNSGSHTVTWDIGSVTGYNGQNVSSTEGEITLEVKIKNNISSGRFCNTATVSTSNGTGWTSNDIPNNITPTRETNCVDVVAAALTIDKSADKTSVKVGDTITYTIDFCNSSDAGWIDGGRYGVTFSVAANPIPGTQTPNFEFVLRGMHAAAEPVIDWGNYRFSYFVNSQYHGSDWRAETVEVQGTPGVTLSTEDLISGSDGRGAWNQRLMLTFEHSMTMPSFHLLKFFGLDYMVHYPGGNEGKDTRPLLLVLRLVAEPWEAQDWTDDWSQLSVAGERLQRIPPISPDWTDGDPSTPGVTITKMNKDACESEPNRVENVLIEEFDGYTWRRVFGNGPQPGRQVENVVVKDVLPSEVTWGGWLGTAGTKSGNTLTWNIGDMLIDECGQVRYWVIAAGSCPGGPWTARNSASVEADREAPVYDEAPVTISCNGVAPTSSIGDYVWEDEDQDGIQDAGESGISGVTVNLFAEGGSHSIATTTTDGSGSYSFSGLTVDEYFIEFVLPDDYAFSPQDATSDANDSDPDVSTGRTGVISVGSGENDMSWDAGMFNDMPKATVEADPGSTTYTTTTLDIDLTTNADRIYYTTDGSNPDTNMSSQLYSTTITISGDVTIKAIAVGDGFLPSDIETWTYTQDLPQATVDADPGSSTYSTTTLEITLSTNADQIYYTTDGSDPDTNSGLQLYSDPIIISGDVTIKAIAIGDGFIPSDIETWTYTQDLPQASVDADPGSTTYTASTLDIALSTNADKIFFTTDGTNPDTNNTSQLYSGAITISGDVTIKAIAVGDGFVPSDIETWNYTQDMPLATITANPGSSVYTTVSLEITLSSESGNSIYYTTDGSLPDTSDPSQLYTGSIVISGDVTVRAIAFGTDYLPAEGSWTYDCELPSATLTANPEGTTYSTVSIDVVLNTNADKIYYTIDGSAPDTNNESQLYSEPINIYGETVTVRAIAVGEGYMPAQGSWVYIRDWPKATVNAEPGSSSYSTTTLDITLTTDAEKIYYTTDGSIPDTNDASQLYSGVITISGDVTIKAVAVGEGFVICNVGSWTYNQDLPYASLNADPGSITYTTPTLDITLTSESGNSIYYTTDGSVPDTNNAAQLYTEPITISGNVTLRAIAFGPGYLPTEASWIYECELPSASLTADPEGTTYSSVSLDVILSTNADRIYYTTDGSAPDTNRPSQLYDEPVYIFGDTVTLRAIAVGDGYVTAQDSWVYIRDWPSATLTADPESMTYTTLRLLVTLTSESGNSIYYTTDGTPPDTTDASQLYTGQITITGDVTLRAIAYGPGYLPTEGTWTYDCELPFAQLAADPTDTTYSTASLDVTLTTDADRIYYTTDGSQPDTNDVSQLYSEPVNIFGDTVTLNAIAIGKGFLPTQDSWVYIRDWPFASLTADPGSTTYTTMTLAVTLSSESGNIIYYTTDGTAPDTTDESQLYSGQFEISGNTVTLRAVAFGPGYLPYEDSWTYIRNLPHASLTADPGSTTYATMSLDVTLSSESGNDIYYTTDGSQPDTNDMSQLYSEPVNIFGDTVTLNAIAVGEGFLPTQDSWVYIRDWPFASLTADPGSTTYTTMTLAVTLSSESGNTIYYTTDGTAPDTSDESQLYSGQFEISDDTVTLRAIAFGPGYLPYEESWTYIRELPRATLTANPGDETGFGLSLEVALSTNADRIYFTEYGAVPDTNNSDQLYTGPIIIPEDSPDTVTISAIAVGEEYSPATESWTYYREYLPEITALPGSIEFVESIDVSLFVDHANAKIYYTLDGAEPDTNSSSTILYTGSPIELTETTTLKAKAFAPDIMPSPLLTEIYTRVFVVSKALYRDSDGDGRIDKVELIFDEIPDSLPTEVVLINPFDNSNKDTVGTSGISWLNGDASTLTAIIILNRPFAEDHNTGFEAGYFGTVTEGLYMNDAFKISDGVAPVINSATYCPGEIIDIETLERTYDTLVVYFSETVENINFNQPFVFKTAGNDQYSFELKKMNNFGNKFVFEVIKDESEEFDYPFKEDSIKIYYEAGVSDTSNNYQDIEDNRYVKLFVKPKPYKLVVRAISPVDPINYKIPDELKTDGINISKGVVIVADFLVNLEDDAEQIKCAVSILDAVGNVVAECKNIDDEQDNIQIGLINDPQTKLVVYWSGQNRNERQVGEGMYVADIRITDHTGKRIQERVLVAVKK